eukprot:882016-Pyramimonas_sp.AAC.1
MSKKRKGPDGGAKPAQPPPRAVGEADEVGGGDSSSSRGVPGAQEAPDGVGQKSRTDQLLAKADSIIGGP